MDGEWWFYEWLQEGLGAWLASRTTGETVPEIRCRFLPRPPPSKL